MFALFRAFSKSWIAQVFMSILVVSFAVWGIKDVFHPVISSAVVSAGSHQVQPSDFKRMFQTYAQQVAQQNGGESLTAQDAVAQGIDAQMLQAVSADTALAELDTRMGITPADSLVADALKRQPQFFDPVSGKFDQQAYEAILRQNGLTPVVFEASLKDEIAQDQVSAGLAAGLKIPLVYGAALASFELEGRSLSYFLVQPNAIQIPAPPTDQQLQAFINAHAEQLRRPEMRLLTIVRFSVKTLAPTLTPKPGDVEKMYDLRKAGLSKPETRSLVEIPAHDAATAQAIIAKLRAGQDPAAVGKALGVQPIAYTNTPKSGVADPSVADAAFSLANGAVSAPIRTALAGLAVVKITGVTPAVNPTLDQLRPQLEAELRNEMATEAVYGQVQKYDDSHSSGGTLAESAQASGATPIQEGPVTASGANVQGQPVQGLSPKLLKTAFALPPKGESDLLDDGAGEYFAVRVDQVVPPALPALNDIRQPLTREWMVEEVVRRINAEADALVAKIKKGETLEAAAAEAHSQVGHAQSVTRIQMMQNRVLGQELAAKLFAAKAGDVIDGQTAQIPVMVARIDAVNTANVAQAAQIVVASRNRESVQLFNDIGAGAKEAAVTQIKPDASLDRARQALGVSPDQIPKSGSSSAPASGAQ